MIEEGKLVSGVDMNGNSVNGKLEAIAGFGMVGVVRTSEDRLGLSHCHIENLTEQEQRQ